MKNIDRYVGGQLLLTSLLAVTVLSVVLFLGNIFKQLLDFLVKNDTPLELILTFLAYIAIGIRKCSCVLRMRSASA